MAIRINLENKNPRKKIDLGKLEKVARSVLRYYKMNSAEVNIRFLSSQKIRALNERYLNRNEATDVIAFQNDPEKPERAAGINENFLGDVAISTDRAEKNAKEYGTRFTEEVALYVIHGLLHLKGLEDKTPKGKQVMRGIENELLQKNKRYL
jgi:probable rRNA maturation factor